jgi:hypothetical protein
VEVDMAYTYHWYQAKNHQNRLLLVVVVKMVGAEMVEILCLFSSKSLDFIIV